MYAANNNYIGDIVKAADTVLDARIENGGGPILDADEEVCNGVEAVLHAVASAVPSAFAKTPGCTAVLMKAAQVTTMEAPAAIGYLASSLEAVTRVPDAAATIASQPAEALTFLQRLAEQSSMVLETEITRAKEHEHGHGHGHTTGTVSGSGSGVGSSSGVVGVASPVDTARRNVRHTLRVLERLTGHPTAREALSQPEPLGHLTRALSQLQTMHEDKLVRALVRLLGVLSAGKCWQVVHTHSSVHELTAWCSLCACLVLVMGFRKRVCACVYRERHHKPRWRRGGCRFAPLLPRAGL